MKKQFFDLKNAIGLAFLGLFLLGATSVQSQPWTYDFGTTTGVHDAGVSETFMPAPTSGTARVRVGTGGGSFNLENPGLAALGTGSELRIIAPTGTSVNKFSVYDYTGGTTGFVSFSVLFGNNLGLPASSGQAFFFIGDGTSFSDNSGFNTSQSMVGLRAIYDNTGFVSLDYRTSTWTNISTTVPQAMVLDVEIYFNNTTTTQQYERGGTYSLAAGTWDLWIAGSRAEAGLPKAGLIDDNNIDSWMFYGASSIGNEANIFIDDVVYSNSLPAATASTEADITDFTVPYQYGTAVIDNTVDPGTVAVDVFTLAYMQNTAPTVGISAGASIDPDPALGIQSIPVQTYTVTAEDGTTQKVWNVTFTEVNHNLATANNNGFSVDMNWDALGCDYFVVHYRQLGTSTWTHKSTNTNSLHLKPLRQDTQYEWRVLYYFDGSVYMGRSQIATFTTPNLIEVTKDLGTTMLFEWNAIAGMTNYIVHYREQGPNPWRHGGSAGTQRKVWNLNEGAIYEYRLLMFDGTTYMGATPIYTHTTTPVTFTVTNITANTAVINWANVGVPAANAYVVHYREAGSSDPWRHGGSTTNSRQVWDLLPNTTYEYRLLVWDTDGYFGASHLETFTTNTAKGYTSWADKNVVAINENLNTFPNPFTNVVNVEFESSDNNNMAWSIFDMSGKLVMSGTQSISAGMNNFAIEARQLPSGLYMLKANIGGTMHTARITKQ
jgi:hypothetical protein